MRLFSILLLIGLTMALALLSFSTQIFAQQSGSYTDARVEIWSLFYRLMVIAFIVGALIMGTIGYIVWRFRESHPRNRFPAGPAEDGARH